MKAVVNDKKNLTFVSHLNGVTIVESSGFIIDLDYQCLTSICEIFDIGNNYSIVESNVDAMNIYFIEANIPTVIRKFNDENFSITCCDVYTAEITNVLLNCGFPVSDIVSTYKSYIAFSNIN